MLDRHGVVTRGAVVSERVPGGFAAVYKVLAAFEETGRCRRGYFVGTLGAAQFGTSGAIDRLRTFAEIPVDAKPVAVALAATDPANPYGAALPWPDRPERAEGEGAGHRPGRKAGAMVVLVDGALALYVERGGRTLLTWPDDAGHEGCSSRPPDALADAARRGALGRITVERADGEQLLGSGATPLRAALHAAGFVATPRGLRLRATGRCPRATRSGGRPAAAAGPVGTDAWPHRLPGARRWPPSTSSAAPSPRRSPGASTCSPASTATTAVDPAHAPEDGGLLADLRARRTLEQGRPTRPGSCSTTGDRIARRLPARRRRAGARASARTDVVGHLGPDLLGPDWDEQEAVRRLIADPDRPLGEALLDQRNLAGIGTIYRTELCFLTGYDPRTPVGAVTDPLRMVRLARSMLDQNRHQAQICTTGDKRRGRSLWVYGRQGEPCLRCGTPIAARRARRARPRADGVLVPVPASPEHEAAATGSRRPQRDLRANGGSAAHSRRTAHAVS